MKAEVATASSIVNVASIVFVAVTAIMIVLFLVFRDKMWLMLVALVLVLIVAWTYLRAPVGYELRDDTLIVRLRAGTKTFGPVARYGPVSEPVSFAVRLWGNGGLFAVTGHYRNKKYGHFQAYVTNLESLVLVETRDGKKIVISPSNPDAWTDTG
jgi:hypothetical protein